MEENKLFLILVGTFVAGVGSVLIAGFLTLTLFSKLGDNFLSLAAGTLLATAFLSLLPEAFRQEQNSSFLMGWLLLGLVIFFILSKVNLYHHGHEHNQSYDKEIQLKESYGSNVGKSWPILIIGDAVHAFGDGVLIASAFFAGTNIGIMATLSVLIHEIPHHVADIAVVRERSKSNVKAMKIVCYAGSFAIFGGISGFFFLEVFSEALAILLVLSASSFIYVSLADLIPQLEKKLKPAAIAYQLIWLLLGIVSIALVSHLHHH
ncbi:MAG: hypothetical protein CBC42_07485 [Betaproteobacteria bacterium TMED82]|nr:MAG: hypothetical protein CBC42_07485 [Betaproteobacteria bacterium TMED82]|tara:strand:- start:17692 stop:18480 length:789 start_codon:yes stop_codon:yes gene_type:complete